MGNDNDFVRNNENSDCFIKDLGKKCSYFYAPTMKDLGAYCFTGVCLSVFLSVQNLT